MKKILEISEIFYSIQGEGRYSGFSSHFIRVAGCNLRCFYCDTKYSWEKGENLSFHQVLKKLSAFPPSEILTITGGEPLLQPSVVDFIRVAKKKYDLIILETNGTLPLKNIPEFVHIAMDLKPPSSEYTNKVFWENLKYLKPTDEIKVPVYNQDDFLWLLKVDNKYNLSEKFWVSLTPVYGVMDYKTLTGWIIESGRKLRLNLQIHKIIFGDERGI